MCLNVKSAIKKKNNQTTGEGLLVRDRLSEKVKFEQ